MRFVPAPMDRACRTAIRTSLTYSGLTVDLHAAAGLHVLRHSRINLLIFACYVSKTRPDPGDKLDCYTGLRGMAYDAVLS